MVCEDGKIRRVLSRDLSEVFGEVGHKIGANALYYLLNHPDRIIRKPRFTEEEAVAAKVLARALGIDTLERGSRAGLFAQRDGATVVELNYEMFPSLPHGQSVALVDITGGAE